MLNKVTLTGADDTIRPEDLLHISRLCPFVEWGILIGSREGVHRFPSRDWIGDLSVVAAASPMNLSLHVCGRYLDELLEGRRPLSGVIPLESFSRMQLNFHGERVSPSAVVNLAAALRFELEPLAGNRPVGVIVQMDGINDWIARELQDRISPQLATIQGLFDRSHGAGQLPTHWPAGIRNLPVGYAGGLGPDNLEVELPKIRSAAGGELIWIDMESSLYHNQQFDLDICRQVLMIASRSVFQSLDRLKQAYLASGGSRCPVCQSESLERRAELAENSLVTCNHCGSSWGDVYSLADMTDFQHGSRHEQYTVFGLYEDTGEAFVDHVVADSPELAAKHAIQSSQLGNLTIISAIRGQHRDLLSGTMDHSSLPTQPETT